MASVVALLLGATPAATARVTVTSGVGVAGIFRARPFLVVLLLVGVVGGIVLVLGSNGRTPEQGVLGFVDIRAEVDLRRCSVNLSFAWGRDFWAVFLHIFAGNERRKFMYIKKHVTQYTTHEVTTIVYN